MNDIVQVLQVSKKFSGNILAIDNVSLSISDGEFVTLLGPSGCGKTTMLRMIAGFEIPTAGKIYLSGEDVTEVPPYERRVNTVFQDYALFPHMTIQENVGYGLRVSGMSKSEMTPAVAQALAMVGLQDKADSRPSNLSGGQKQRVALARAMVRKPKVLLLDEPLSALDANLREAMQLELKHLHQQSGITFVFVTHDQTEALVMSDRVVVMDAGRIAQSGTPQELYDQPASPYIADFIGSSNKLYGTVLAVDGDLVDLDLGGIRLQASKADCQFRVGDRVVATIRPEKVQLEGGIDIGNIESLAQNEVPGMVREVLFHGSSCRLKIDIGQRKLFDVDVQLHENMKSMAFSKPDTEVLVRINPKTVSVFPVSEDSTA